MALAAAGWAAALDKAVEERAVPMSFRAQRKNQVHYELGLTCEASPSRRRTQRHVFYPPSAPFPHTHTLQCPTAFSSVRLPACLPACARREHAFALERGRSPGQGGPLPSLSPGSFCVLARGSWPASARPASRSCPSVRPSVCVRHSARSAARVVSPRPPRQSHACLSVATRTRAAWVGHRVCLRYPGRLPAHRRSSP